MSSKGDHGQGASERDGVRDGGGAPASGRYRNRVGALLLAAACGFVLYGLFRGEAAIVLNKAVNICLECIGLG